MQSDFNYIEKVLRQAVANAAIVAPFFNAADVKIYLQGSYVSQTNTCFQSKLEVVVEVQKTKQYNYELMQEKDQILREEFFVDFNYYFDVKRFKDAFIGELQKLLPQTKLNLGATNVVIPVFGPLQHSIDIYPCFRYKYFFPDGGSVRAKLVYDRKLEDHYLIFTNLHANNGDLKDQMTNGNFKKMVRLCKTIMAMNVRENLGLHQVRGYFMECLLYNVPNNIYYANDGSLKTVFLKVINWLNFADFDDFVCQNQIWSFWGVADGFWSKGAARQFVHDLIELYQKFPDKRTEVVRNDSEE